MATKTGIGFSENPNSRDAGIEAAKPPWKKQGRGHAVWLFFFRHQNMILRDGVRSVIGPKTSLIGGYANGIITRDKLGYDGYQIGVAVMSTDSMNVDMFIEEELTNNEYHVGVELGRKIKSKDYEGPPNIILMYDSVKEMTTEGLSLNLASPFIEGMEKSLGVWPPAAGAGMLGDFQFNPT